MTKPAHLIVLAVFAQRRRPHETRGQRDVEQHVECQAEISKPAERVVLIIVAALHLRIGHHEQSARSVVLALEGLEAAAEEEDGRHHED